MPTTRRFYSNDAPQRTLAGSLTSSSSTLAISGSFAGWPTQFPFYATLDIGTASAEIVLVTAVASSVATIVRGQDGTAAITHASGATFDQTVVRQDFDEASAHTSANAGVHGVSGSVVGTTDSQTLTNKTLASPIVTGTLAGATQTLSGALTVSGGGTGLTVAHDASVGGNASVTGSVTSGPVTASAAATTALAATMKPKAAGVALSVRNVGDTADEFTIDDAGNVVAQGGIKVGGSNHVFGLFGRGTALVSDPMPTTAEPLIQAGTVTVTTNGSSIGVFSWPAAFPNGVLSAVLTTLTDSVTQLRDVGGGGISKTQCEFVARTPSGSGAANSTVALSYIAIGW